MKGKLFLCATPIGNLEDITYRVLETLKNVDLIAAEDTRNSIKLLNHFDIKTPMTSYHEFNKIEKGEFLVQEIMSGKQVALITDAGTPAISDPGEELVRMCIESGVEVTSLPGAAACITALTLSGLSTRRFCFEGFLPSDKKESEEVLKGLVNETRTIILYEAPHRLIKTLNRLSSFLGNPKIALCRELTKKFETIMRGSLEEMIEYYSTNEPKGEYVIVIQGKSMEDLKRQERDKWDDVDINTHMEIYTSKGIDKKEAMKMVAKDRGISKRDVYKALLEE